MVDNKPFLIVGAQCDGRTIWKQDKTVLAFYDGYQKMHATAVGVNIMWSKCEPEKDHYDFSPIDWNIKQAEAHGLKIVMQHFGSNVCGVIEVPGVIRWTPEYLLKDPKTYSQLNLGTEEKPNTQSAWAMCPNDPNTLERKGSI